MRTFRLEPVESLRDTSVMSHGHRYRWRADRLLIKTSAREGRTSTRARTCHFQDTTTVAGRIYRESRARAEEQPSSRPRASRPEEQPADLQSLMSISYAGC